MERSPLLQQVVEKLRIAKGADKEGWYTAFCVFHPDQKTANLRVNEHGFCCMRCNVKGGLRVLAARLEVATTPTSFADRVIAEYDYRDGDSKLLFQVVRLFPKDFRQRHPDGAGGWIWDLKSVKRLLYRLPDLQTGDSSRTVYVVEGEKDADRLAGLGLVATTCPMGAGKWRPEYTETLRGRTVVILPDNDEAGLNHARQISVALRGVAASVRVLRLPGLQDKGDVSDWLDAGGTAEELASLIEGTQDDTHVAGPPSVVRLVSARELMKMDLPEPKWAVPELLPEGLAILGGKPKMGKSWLALNLGLAVASGGVSLGLTKCEPGDVLYLALEDTDRRLQSRLLSILGEASAPASLTLTTAWPRLDESGVEELETWLRTHPEARLVIIDTLAKVRSPRGRNDTLYESDYAAVAALKALADRFGVAILVLHHLRKMDAPDPVDAISGTLGLSGAADAILVLKRDRGQRDASLFVTGRDLDEQDLQLSWDETLCSWKVIPDQELLARISRERNDVLDLFRNNGNEPLAPAQIAALLHKNANAIRKLLRSMAKAEQLSSQDSFYWLPNTPISNHTGNSSNSGNGGNSGNTPGPVTGVTGLEEAAVTPKEAQSNLEVEECYRITGVSGNHSQPDLITLPNVQTIRPYHPEYPRGAA